MAGGPMLRALLTLLTIFCILITSGAARADGDDEREVIKKCLRAWKKHPFSEKKFDYKVLKAGVKVMGIGNDAEDTDETSKPALVLVRPSVNVLTKGSYKLLNP